MRSCFARLSLAASALAISAAQGAFAADIPPPVLKAPAAVVGVNWTGFYVNGGVGYGLWSASTNTVATPTSVDAPTPLVSRVGGKGWLGRVGGGFDYQFHPKIVAGVFADYDFSDLEGTIHDLAPSISADIKQSRSWAAGGRFGWLMTPELLSYTTVGYSNARFSSGRMVDNGAGNFGGAFAPSGWATPAFSKSGWFLGGGAEVSVGSGLFWRTEYRYAYYGNQAITDVNATTGVAFTNINFKPTVQTVTTQLVYKFNSGRPPVVSAPASTVAANWSGVYANAGAGYGMWVADETTSAVAGAANPTVVVPQTMSGRGYLGRVGVGFDQQFHSRFVAGLLADFDFSSMRGSLQDSNAGLEGQTRARWSWAVGARAGVLITPTVLAYVNAGYTQTRFSETDMFFVVTGSPFGGFTTQAFTADGWFVGGGTEAPIAPGWFWRNEYRYADYGTESVSNTSPLAGALVRNNINFKPVLQTVTTQILYKFNWGR